MSKGKFITLEGGEGAGKTQASYAIKEYLESVGYRVIITREPGGITISEQIRRVILDVDNTSMDSRTEALLYAAARRQHLVEKVIPALESGMYVLCDRFVDSSIVYQGYARGIGADAISSLNRFATGGIEPDLTFWFNVDPLVGLNRVHANLGREVNRLDLESLDFHQKVRQGYLELYRERKDRIFRVDANESQDKVIDKIRTRLLYLS